MFFCYHMDQNDNLEHQTIHQIHALVASTVAVGQGAFQDEMQEKVNNCYKTQVNVRFCTNFCIHFFLLFSSKSNSPFAHYFTVVSF